MAKAAKKTAPDPLARGWAELSEARWEAARAFFEESLAAEETPEAFEGLSWAAWWLDDGPVVFEARERAYRLYRRTGEPASAARMATWLACDQLDFHGAWAVASVGSGGRIVCWIHSSRGPITAGLIGLRATSRTRPVRPRGPRSSRAGRRSLGGDSDRPTWKCSGWRSRAPRWCRAPG
jgi:hypothetical protein